MDTVFYKQSNTHCHREPIQEMLVAGLKNHQLPSDLMLTKEQSQNIKDAVAVIYLNPQTEVTLTNIISSLSSEIGITFEQVRAIISRVWMTSCWNWDSDVVQYLEKRDWERFIYNKGNGLEISLPRTMDINDIIHKPITVSFQGWRYYEFEDQIGSYYFDKVVDI